MRDSADVEIVSNGERPAAQCVLAGEPEVRIGGADAQGPYDLLYAFPRRLSDGRIVVLNRSTAELRFFDQAGRHVRTAGRRGSGPGEMQAPFRPIPVAGDSVVVPDGELRRLTVFDSSGAVAATWPHSREYGFLGVLVDGSQLLTAQRSSPPSAGKSRDTVRLLARRPDGALDSVARYLGTEYFYVTGTRGWVGTDVPYGRSTTVAFQGDRVYVGDNAEYRVRVYGRDGRLLRIVEKEHRSAPLTDELVARERERRRAASREPEFFEMTLGAFDRGNLSGTLPSFSRVLADRVGWMWVAEYVLHRDSALAWDGFDETGRLRCALRQPPRFRVDEIGPDYLLGVARDEDDVEQVQIWRLERR